MDQFGDLGTERENLSNALLKSVYTQSTWSLKFNTAIISDENSSTLVAALFQTNPC